MKASNQDVLQTGGSLVRASRKEVKAALELDDNAVASRQVKVGWNRRRGGWFSPDIAYRLHEGEVKKLTEYRELQAYASASEVLDKRVRRAVKSGNLREVMGLLWPDGKARDAAYKSERLAVIQAAIASPRSRKAVRAVLALGQA